ncbi:ATP-binding protein [Streptomyces sp. P38-E01]|uniref:histidine kinase n=1 Tax=Streptomyces tardus TaxID=2780544 RepID=A0A949N2H4_9ACTN|nr:ATP-binding protein [Streptomyces tardus]MBU7598940.1 ATP-binding protein [Streptomyces tardus]
MQFLYGAVQEEARHFAQVRLPALVDVVARGYPGAEVPGLRHPQVRGTAVQQSYDEVEAQLREAVSVVRGSIGRASRAGVRATAEDAQMYLARCQVSIFTAHDAPDSELRQWLMDFDHLVTRALHVQQRLRILAGSWPGVQRADCPVRMVIESAQGRIDGFQRVRYTYLPSTGEVFVEGRVAEALTVALAELLANSIAWSAEHIDVTVQEVQTGLRIVVEDYGIGLTAQQRVEAEQLLSQSTVIDTTNLTERLGFSVIGRLVHEYGFGVDVSAPSSGGGVRAAVMVPARMLRSAPAPPDPLPERRPLPGAAPREHADGPSGPVSAPMTTAQGLPKRRRQQPTSAPQAAPKPVTDALDAHAIVAGLQGLGHAIHTNFPADEGDSHER